MMKDDTYYAISKTRLREMLKAEAQFQALCNGGVDNWEWCGESCQDYLDEYLRENADIVNSWDYDDPRKEDFDFDDLVDLEIRYYARILN